ncbi:MAG: murein transglycosylase A [Rickettsiales bacterium]
MRHQETGSWYQPMQVNKVLSLLLIIFITSCSPKLKPRVMNLQKTDFSEMKNWQSDNHSKALIAFKASCEKFMAFEPEKPVSKLTQIGGSTIDWQVPCMDVMLKERHTDNDAKEFFEKWFVPYEVTDEGKSPVGTLTGYFEIELHGSKKRTEKYRYPVYASPSDLKDRKGDWSFDHASINNGALTGRNLELAWVDNRARLYFMHIQGSGVIKLAEGGEMRVGFAGHNGYRFHGISKAVKDRDLKFKSTHNMLDWLQKNEDECQQILESDPSYVFFQEVKAASALGGQGVPLMRERSLAVDCYLYPYGTPIWVESELPATQAFKPGLYSRLFIAQDTGSVIRGAVRGDVFFGRGKKAEQVANSFKTKGKFIALFPKTVPVPAQYESLS